MKALQTTHDGTRFRSRLEARWAVFLDELGMKWRYEPEGFDLGGGLCYLPDFYLPGLELWLEIKPQEPNDEEREKAEKLAEGSGKRVAVVWETPLDHLEGCHGEVFEPIDESLEFQVNWDNHHKFCACVCGRIGFEYEGRAERVCPSGPGHFPPLSSKCQDPSFGIEAAKAAETRRFWDPA